MFNFNCLSLQDVVQDVVLTWFYAKRIQLHIGWTESHIIMILMNKNNLNKSPWSIDIFLNYLLPYYQRIRKHAIIWFPRPLISLVQIYVYSCVHVEVLNFIIIFKYLHVYILCYGFSAFRIYHFLVCIFYMYRRRKFDTKARYLHIGKAKKKLWDLSILREIL